MDSEFICGGKEYEAYIQNDEYTTIGIPVNLLNLPEEINVQGLTLYLPNPFHVSLFYMKRSIDRYNISIPDFTSKILDDFCEFTKNNKIKITSFKNNEYRLVSRDGVWKTVVVMCEVSNLNKFFDFVNNKYDLKIKHPTPHVTLYNTRKREHGMYLMDSDDIANFTTPIENPIGRQL